MTSISGYAKEQYELVKSSRHVLLDYCKTITGKDFIDQNTSFGRGGSIRNLLVHIINTYEHWIANIALKKNISYSEYEKSKNVKDIISGFEQIDKFMNELIENMDSLTEINYNSGDTKDTVNAFKLFTHVITHEYHHKGQILSLSRHLNYTPVDTDVMR